MIRFVTFEGFRFAPSTLRSTVFVRSTVPGECTTAQYLICPNRRDFWRKSSVTGRAALLKSVVNPVGIEQRSMLMYTSRDNRRKGLQFSVQAWEFLDILRLMHDNAIGILKLHSSRSDWIELAR